MLVRAIALSLALLIGIGTIIPLATQSTEAGPRKQHKHRKHAKHYKKYSKGWWRQYRARMKRKRALQARKRALRLRQIRLAKANQAAKAANTVAKFSPEAKRSSVSAATAVLPSGEQAPSGWKAGQSTAAELQFRVDNSTGDQIGSAAISVVGPAVAQSSEAARSRSVGGVATTSLRREVIDRMIRENGWVVNDYQKEIAGQPVYVVVAQSQAKNGAVQSRMFYFTEVDGRIYSVATNSPVQESERLAEESEKVINSLKRRVRPTQRASN
ncbi:hypothetical protein BH10ACI3_BH10ACI3_16240 [soil metagenome]